MQAWTPFVHVPGRVVDPDGVEGTLWQNNRYQVVLRRREVSLFGPCVHLTIRSLDGEPRHDWRDFQRIKNELVGPETEGVELYPAESRLVDTANHYHLWVFPEYRFPFGMTARDVSSGTPGVSQRDLLEPEDNE
ncbi:MAG: hypothetical protein ACK47B_22180 [Armatimonadota bacterium]